MLCELSIQMDVFDEGLCGDTRFYLMYLVLGVFEVVLFGVVDVGLIVQVMSVCRMTVQVGVFGVG